jgi:hypothetical protein
MLKFLIGPLLLGVGYIVGSIAGRDSEQLVHKSPSETYAAIEAAADNVPHSGTTFFDGGRPMPYQIKVDRTPDDRLALSLLFGGQLGAEAEFQLTPENGGRDTLVTVHLHGSPSVLRTALAGTSKAKLAYAPDWMLNLTARPMLRQLAEQIERGGGASLAPSGDSSPQEPWESNLTTAQQEQAGEWQQDQATRPAVDPNTDAHTYLAGNSDAE